MKENKNFKMLVIFAIAATMCLTGFAVLPTVGADPNLLYNPLEPTSRGNIPSGTIKSVFDICSSLIDGADYLKHAQADITEDNAGNGNPDSPDDPDDGGWDWRLTSPAFTHSTAASPPNIYGATAQGLYYAYLQTGDATYKTALDDAAGVMSINAGIRSAADLIFLMLYDDLPSVAGTIYQDAARAKYDARITTYGSATLFAQYIRDVRALSHGYPNGIIAWDIGAWARAAAMLHDRYPGNGYDSDADDIAEVIYQDSFMLNPGYFDIYSDDGWDPTYATVDYWWYTLGITGLIDAFNFANVHTSDIPTLISILMNCQYPSGAFSFSYGANTLDEDWQSTAYAVLSLAMLDQDTYQTNINDAGSWIASTQDVSGGWVYGSGNHYPEIGGENTAALYFGGPVKNIDTGETFCTIQSAIDDSDTVNGHTIEVSSGTYYENVIVDKELTLQAGSTPIIDGGGSGNGILIQSGNVVIDGFDITNCDNGIRSYGGPAIYNNVEIKNCDIYHNKINGILIVHDFMDNLQIKNTDISDTYGNGHNAIGFGNGAQLQNLLIQDVTITGVMTSGHGIYANGVNLNTVLFDNVDISNAGQWEGIHIINSVVDMFDVLNSKITNSGGFGVIFKGSTTTQHVRFDNTEISNSNGGSGLAFVCFSYDTVIYECTFFGNAWEDIDFGTGWMGPSQFDDTTVYGCEFTGGPAWAQVYIDSSAIILNNFDVNQNNFRNGWGIANGNAVEVDGTCNWWNTVAGPNAGGADFYGPVKFCPWLAGSYPGGDCDGGLIAHNIDKDTWYCCIQCAIDDANDYNTIEVLPGTYEEILTITKPLTLLGATHDICKKGYPVPANYAWDDTVESIIQPPAGHEDDLVVYIYDTDDVTFKGFIVQALERSSSGNRMLIHVEAQTQNIENLDLSYNVIGPNTNLLSQDGNMGRMNLDLDLNPYDASIGITDSLIACNKIFDSKGNGNNIFIWASYYSYGATGPSPMTNTYIEDNEICGSHRSGIETAGGFTGLTIRNNDIHSNSGNPGDVVAKLKYGTGILMIRGSSDKTCDGYGPENLLIDGNEIHDNEKMGIYSGPIASDITITCNNIHDNGWDGIMLDIEGQYWNPQYEPGPGPYPCYEGFSNIVANCNEITGNGEYGVRVNGIPTNGFVLDATCNWWGSGDGPGPVGPGSGDTVSDNVNFDTWLGQMIACADGNCEGLPYVTNASKDFKVSFTPCWTNAGGCECECLSDYDWADPVSFFWDFGDGETSDEKFPTHYYDPDCPPDGSNIHYTVTLTITFANGAVASDTATVIVECIDSDPALIQLVYPTGGETLSGTVTVRWFALDQQLQNNLPIYLYYSADQGDTWRQINDVLYNYDNEGHGEYDWSTTSLSDGYYMLKAEAVKPGVVVASTSDIFTVNNGIVGAMVSDVRITDTDIDSDLWVKDGDSVEITAGITGASELTIVTADLSGLGGGSDVPADSFDGFTATWTLSNVVCHPSDGPITATVKLDSDKSNSATITADNTNPALSIDKPQDGLYFFNSRLLPLSKTIIIGGITIEVDAEDTSGIDRAEFYLDGELMKTDTSSSPEWYMNIKLRGQHDLEVIVYDHAGNKITESKMIKVYNFFGK